MVSSAAQRYNLYDVDPSEVAKQILNYRWENKFGIGEIETHSIDEVSIKILVLSVIDPFISSPQFTTIRAHFRV